MSSDQTTPNAEPAVRLPTAALLAAGVLVPLALGAAWWLGCTLLDTGPQQALAGPVAAALIAICMSGSMLMMGPWNVRPVGIWMTLWLAGTVVRLLLVPLGTILLYSATSLNAMALGVSVGLTYLFTLLSETTVLARYMSRATP